MSLRQASPQFKNSMAEYEMQKMNLPNKDGKQLLYPRIVLRGQKGTKELAKNLAGSTTFRIGEVVGLLSGLSEEMSFMLAQGYSVKLEGVGTFTAGLGLVKGKERESGEEGDVRRNAQSIEVTDIHFQPEKEFVRQTAKACVLTRSQKKFRTSSTRLTEEQRKACALTYLEAHPFLTVRDYMTLTGLCHSTAALELKAWAHEPDSALDYEGMGSHRVYVRRGE